MKYLVIRRSLLVATLLHLVSVSSASAFARCEEDVPSDVAYSPGMVECYGNAAIILRGSYRGAFSVVVRDGNNSDRNPKLSDCEYNWCSPYKVHKVVETDEGRINCLGMPGSARLMRAIRRVTIKMRNPVQDKSKDILRYCISSSTEGLNISAQ